MTEGSGRIIFQIQVDSAGRHQQPNYSLMIDSLMLVCFRHSGLVLLHYVDSVREDDSICDVESVQFLKRIE
jgi:hypothetical protein